MVDHTYIYSGPIQKIKQILESGEIGDVYFIDSVRINLGMFQHDVNVVWDLAPHDLSILDYLIPKLPRSVSAFGTCHVEQSADIEDVAYLNLDFSDGLLASFHVNWLSPVKVRHFIIGGSKKSIVYDDLEPTERLKIYDRGVTINDDMEARRGVMVGYRTGDVWSPHIPHVEPLAQMVRHFAECIRENKQPLTSGEAGLRVVKILDAAQRSIKAQGGRITIWDERRHAA
jgi:predicted dehydrogenase